MAAAALKADMSADAARYYAGGKRRMVGGIPKRVPAWLGNTAGKAFIASAVAGQVEIDGDNRPDELARFRFVPAGGARAIDAKPSKRKGYAYVARFKSISGWRPANLACDPYECHARYGGLTDTPHKLADALRHYHGGSPEPLRKYLADTAGERRAYWAAYDAAQAAERAANWRIAA